MLTTKEAPAYSDAIEGILEQRQKAQARERAVIEGLNGALSKIGYKIVPLRGSTKPEPRLGGSGDSASSDALEAARPAAED